jgi:hypothetical protein
MERSRFLENEYITLREEIKNTKERLFRLAGIGLVGVPAAYSVAKIYDIKVLVLSLPILICIIVLLYMSESRALMRCGSYIKKKIERNVEGNLECQLGWEHWLSKAPKNKSDRRAVDKFLATFFFLLFAFYYGASVHLASTTAYESFGLLGLSLTLAAYSAIGIVFSWFFAINFSASIKTDD